MSTNTIKMPTAHDVNEYVQQVRAELADLPPDDVEELTGGLEADLAERLAESPDGLAGLGSPQVYAAELRSAAGLPARGSAGGNGLGAWWRHLREVAALAARDPRLARVRRLAEELRPVGWVVRGAALGFVYVRLTDQYHEAWWIAAVAVVAGIGVPLLHQHADDRLDTAASNAAPDRATPSALAGAADGLSRDAQDKAVHAETSRARGKVPHAYSAEAPVSLPQRRLRADLLGLREQIPARAPYTSTTVVAAPGFTCAHGRFGRGYLVGVRYAGSPAVVAFRRPVGSTQVAEVLQCGTAQVLRSVTLPGR